METFIGWILGISLIASFFTAIMSGGATMPLILAAVLGVSVTVAASALAVINAIKAASVPK
jgi:hypothetical protein